MCVRAGLIYSQFKRVLEGKISCTISFHIRTLLIFFIAEIKLFYAHVTIKIWHKTKQKLNMQSKSEKVVDQQRNTCPSVKKMLADGV